MSEVLYQIMGRHRSEPLPERKPPWLKVKAPGGPGMTDCGPGNANCCTSLAVPAGTYARSFDGFTYKDNSNLATLTAFKLDKYEVTVGRFRQFVAAVADGWRPTAGAGKHVHLNLGKGLNAVGGGYETGWVASWTSNLATTASGWDMKLSGGTWSPGPAAACGPAWPTRTSGTGPASGWRAARSGSCQASPSGTGASASTTGR